MELLISITAVIVSFATFLFTVMVTYRGEQREKKQAEVVKRIYREYLSGNSLLKIKRSLEADGVLNGAGRGKWHETNIKQIFTNEKYIGDALLQKTYTVDILEKKREANKGQVPKYYVEDSHEGIIPKDIFLKVQEEIVRRANLTKGTTRHKRVYSGRYALSGIVFCAHCGDIFRRIKWNQTINLFSKISRLTGNINMHSIFYKCI